MEIQPEFESLVVDQSPPILIQNRDKICLAPITIKQQKKNKKYNDIDEGNGSNTPYGSLIFKENPNSGITSAASRSLINSPMKYKSVQKRGMDNSRLMSQHKGTEDADQEAAIILTNEYETIHKKSVNNEILTSSGGQMIATTEHTFTSNLINQQNTASRDFNTYGMTNWYSTLDSTEAMKHNMSTRRVSPSSKIAARFTHHQQTSSKNSSNCFPKTPSKQEMILRKQIDLDHFDRDLFGGSSDCKGRYRSLYGISAIRNLQPLSQSKSRAPQGLNTEPTSQKRKNIIFKKMSQTN